MSLHTLHPYQPHIGGPNEELFIPFRAFVKFVPDLANGRRWEMIRHFEKVQFLIEDALVSETSIEISEQVAFTVQIGQSPGRFTIVGFHITSGENDPPVDTATQPGEIHSGTVPGEKTAVIPAIPRGGDLARRQDPAARTTNQAVDLRSDLESALSGISGLGEVFYLEYNGVKYGQIPNRKGFRSLQV